jgi:hypothetical protein
MWAIARIYFHEAVFAMAIPQKRLTTSCVTWPAKK